MTKLRCIESNGEYYTVGKEYNILDESESCSKPYYLVDCDKSFVNGWYIPKDSLIFCCGAKFELVTEDEEVMKPFIKEGDRVYVTLPNQGVVIDTVDVTANGKLNVLNDQLRFTSDGKFFNKELRVVYLVNEENYKALCQLHGEENVPHYDPMIRALDGGSHIALVSNVSAKHAIEKQLITLIECYKDGMYVSRKVNQWKYAVPCNERGEPIV